MYMYRSISCCNKYIPIQVLRRELDKQQNGNICNENLWQLGKKLNKQNYLRIIKMKNELQGDQQRIDSNKNHIRDTEEQQKNQVENENDVKGEVKKDHRKSA